MLNIAWMVFLNVLISVTRDEVELCLVSLVLVGFILMNILIPCVDCLLLRYLFWLWWYRLSMVDSSLDLVL